MWSLRLQEVEKTSEHLGFLLNAGPGNPQGDSVSGLFFQCAVGGWDMIGRHEVF